MMHHRGTEDTEDVIFSFSASQKKKKAQRSLRLCGENLAFCGSWAAPITGIPDSSMLSCYRAYDVGGGTWSEGLAQAILTRREQGAWQAFSRHKRRRRQWLLGRLAAKAAVCDLVKEREVGLRDVEICAEENGRPVVSKGLAKKLGYDLAVSIAHSKRDVVGIAARCGRFRSIGVDLEPVGQECEELERMVLCATERQFLSEGVFERKGEGILRFWCIKEAVAKAIGLGMVGGPLSLIVEELELHTGRATVSIVGALSRKLPAQRDKVFTAYCGCADGLVFATSIVN